MLLSPYLSVCPNFIYITSVYPTYIMTKHFLDYQEYAVASMDANPSLGIFFEPGCGKTAVALTWLARALADRRISDALVICPSSLVPNWRKDIEESSDFDSIGETGRALLMDSVTVTSFQKTYEARKRIIRHRDGYEETKKDYYLRPAVDREWGAIIIDESHCIGAHSSRQTKTAMTLARLTRHRYILTGTPVSGSTSAGGADYSKLYGQFSFLCPGIWSSWSDFTRQYVTEWGRFYNPVAYDEEKLRKLMFDKSIAMTLDECADLPGYTETMVPCPLAEKKVYKDVKKGDFGAYNLEIPTPGGQYTKLMQLVSGFMYTTEGKIDYKTSKIDVLSDILDGTEGKTVIFAQFTPSIDRIKALCEEKGLNTAVFDGRSKGPEWQKLNEDADVLITQWQAGGAGLNLQAASTLIAFEPCQSSVNWIQGRARIYRKGQNTKCRFIYLYTPDTIEKKVYESVMNSVTVTDKMMRSWVLENEL